MQDLNKLHTFVKVAARGSFTIAARELRVSPSAVSKQVQQLEKTLSVSLLNRSTRGVSLTEAGAAFFQRCQEALASLDDAVSQAQMLHAGSAGTLRVHVVAGFAQRELAPLIGEFMRANPQIVVEMSASTPAKSLVEAGADVVVSGKTMPDPGAVWRELGLVDYVVCAAPQYLARHGTPAKPEELRNHNCLLHTFFTPREWPFRSGSREKLVRVSGTFKSNNSEVLAQLALAGLGVARVPVYVVRDAMREGRLVSLFDGQPTSRQIMRVYYPSHDNLPEKTKLFLRFLEASFKSGRKR